MSWEADGGVQFTPSDHLTATQAAAIAKVYTAYDANGTLRITGVGLHSKLKALYWLGQYLGLWGRKAGGIGNGTSL